MTSARKKRPIPSDIPDAPAPTPRPKPEAIAALADRVERGDVVTTDLNDGSFVLLMTALQARGYALTARKRVETELKPFLFKVRRA